MDGHRRRHGCTQPYLHSREHMDIHALINANTHTNDVWRKFPSPCAPFAHLSCAFLDIYRSSYRIIVQRTDDEDEELPSSLELLNYAASQQKKVKYYVTAYMSAASVDWSAPFTVGDEKSFGDYENVKLKKGETYTIYEMAAVTKVRIEFCARTVYELQSPQSVTRAHRGHRSSIDRFSLRKWCKPTALYSFIPSNYFNAFAYTDKYRRTPAM